MDGLLLILLVMAYVLPTFTASVRAHPNVWPILVINLLLGWTLLGWVVALAWSCSAIRRHELVLWTDGVWRPRP